MYSVFKSKLAVKIPRCKPSSRLLVGRWYTHVHQIQMSSNDGFTEWSKLRTARLTRILRKTFGSNYHPRSIALKNSAPSRDFHKSSRRLNKKPNQHKHKTLTNFPIPMQAPKPWPSPRYYPSQQPLDSNVYNQTRLATRQT